MLVRLRFNCIILFNEICSNYKNLYTIYSAPTTTYYRRSPIIYIIVENMLSEKLTPILVNKAKKHYKIYDNIII